MKRFNAFFAILSLTCSLHAEQPSEATLDDVVANLKVFNHDLSDKLEKLNDYSYSKTELLKTAFEDHADQVSGLAKNINNYGFIAGQIAFLKNTSDRIASFASGASYRYMILLYFAMMRDLLGVLLSIINFYGYDALQGNFLIMYESLNGGIGKLVQSANAGVKNRFKKLFAITVPHQYLIGNLEIPEDIFEKQPEKASEGFVRKTLKRAAGAVGGYIGGVASERYFGNVNKEFEQSKDNLVTSIFDLSQAITQATTIHLPKLQSTGKALINSSQDIAGSFMFLLEMTANAEELGRDLHKNLKFMKVIHALVDFLEKSSDMAYTYVDVFKKTAVKFLGIVPGKRDLSGELNAVSESILKFLSDLKISSSQFKAALSSQPKLIPQRVVAPVQPAITPVSGQSISRQVQKPVLQQQSAFWKFVSSIWNTAKGLKLRERLGNKGALRRLWNLYPAR